MVDPAQALSAFFAAENTRDWDAYARFLHADVEWTLVQESGTRTVRGSSQYVSAIKAAYGDSTQRFRAVQTLLSESSTRAAVLLIDDSGRRSLEVFEWEGDLLRREWEFMFGAGPEWALSP